MSEQVDAVTRPELPERRTGMDVVNIRLKSIEDSLADIKRIIEPVAVLANRVSTVEHRLDCIEALPSHSIVIGEHMAIIDAIKERIALNEKAIESTNRRLESTEKGIYVCIDEMKEKGFSRTWAILMSLFTMIVGGFIGYLFFLMR